MKKDPLIKIDFIKTPTAQISNIKDLQKYHLQIKPFIEERENHFADIFKNAGHKEIFAELAFCLFTPQSKAVSCWAAVNELADKAMLFNSTAKEIANVITKVRFRNNKSKYLVSARDMLVNNAKTNIKDFLSSFNDIYELRAWLIKNIKGIAYKEASHFLRNIGIGKNLAILDRHILKNLKILGAIKDIPKSLTAQEYLDIEKQMQNFSKKIKIPMSHLDMLLWCKESGGIFK
ncbi:MAG: N-glycosylase/DNA lyase [Elusimicrobiota bacterium]|jgi:N-glycosylase/DNA lyase|nr:N-glycosylase/DNA lyase [Elusimicrobiota bacterium]